MRSHAHCKSQPSHDHLLHALTVTIVSEILMFQSKTIIVDAEKIAQVSPMASERAEDQSIERQGKGECDRVGEIE